MRIKTKLEKQFEEYIIENKDKHYRIAYSYVKNADDALDIVQEAVFKALISLASLNNPDYFRSWFYKVLINTALDFIRKQKKIISVDSEFLSDLDKGRMDTYQDIDLHRSLLKLPEDYRSIIILRFFEDLKIEEVAEILDENVNTVKTRLYKALELLRVEMND